MHQSAIKLVPVVTPQGYHEADLHAFTEFESCDRLSCYRFHYPPTGNLSQLSQGRIQQFLVLGCFPDTHAYNDLFQSGYLHYRLVAELIHEGFDYLVPVQGFQPRLFYCRNHYNCSPHFLQKRTF